MQKGGGLFPPPFYVLKINMLRRACAHVSDKMQKPLRLSRAFLLRKKHKGEVK